MRDALGGTVVLSIIIVFIVIALGYMAFNVNYMKAFNMKNKVISVYEAYDGDCVEDCQKKIQEYSKKIGYTMGQMTCHEMELDPNHIYCAKEVDASNERGQSDIQKLKGNGSSDIKERYYYKITTKINIEIPVISRIFDFRLFEITGDTKVFEKK